MLENTKEKFYSNAETVSVILNMYEAGWQFDWLATYFDKLIPEIEYYVQKYACEQVVALSYCPLDLSEESFELNKHTIAKELFIHENITKSEHAALNKVQLRNIHKRKALGVREEVELSESFSAAAKRKASKVDTECQHGLWITRCSICGDILECDVRINADFAARKLFYNNINDIVCSFPYSKVLHERMNIRLNSVFYWVYIESIDSLTLRTEKNIPSDGKAMKAFTSSELCKLLLALPVSKRTETFYEDVAKSAENPTALAKMLLKTKGILTHEEVVNN